jgi:hypothetical protein
MTEPTESTTMGPALLTFHILENDCVDHYVAAHDEAGALAVLATVQDPDESTTLVCSQISRAAAMRLVCRSDGDSFELPKSLALLVDEQCGKPGYIAGSEY